MSEDEPEEVVAKFGRDDNLEAKADKLLRDGIGRNKRSKKRDVEKMLFEAGLIGADELERFDPANDWDTQDEVPVTLVSPSDLVNYSPTICADVSDGNIRERNPALATRQTLMRHVDDEEGWGGAPEPQPLPPLEIGPRKVCTKCGRSKGLQCFSPKADAKDKLHPWCKPCRKESVSQRRGGGE